MEITDIERSKKHDRVSVYIDGSYSFSVSEEDYLSLGLYENREISQDEIEYIKNKVNLNSAKYAAVKYLALKLRTSKEVERKLEEKGYDKESISFAIEELTSMGYINDRIYAQKFIHERIKLKPKSKKMLEIELKRKGIQQELIEEALDEMEVDEETVAESLLRRKFGKYDLRDEKILRKAYSFLMHRGFSYSLIEGVIRKVIDDK